MILFEGYKKPVAIQREALGIHMSLTLIGPADPIPHRRDLDTGKTGEPAIGIAFDAARQPVPGIENANETLAVRAHADGRKRAEERIARHHLQPADKLQRTETGFVATDMEIRNLAADDLRRL